MPVGRRVTGDDMCDVVCPSGPPPACPKEACHRALKMFERSMDPIIIIVKPKPKPKKKAAKK